MKTRDELRARIIETFGQEAGDVVIRHSKKSWSGQTLNILAECWKTIRNLDAFETVVRCVNSTELYALVMFPETFSRPFTAQHKRLFNVLDNVLVQQLNVAGARGLGKTTIISKAFIGRHITFGLCRHVVYIQRNEKRAVEKMENLKRQLLTSPQMRNLGLPDIRANDAAEFGVKWEFSQEAWVANGYTKVGPQGAFMPVRGSLFGDYRPDLIVLDDVEEPREMRNEDLRDGWWRWLNGDVCEAVEIGSKTHRIICIDTVKHEDCFPLRLKALPNWCSITLPLCDKDFKSKIPEWLSDDQIAEKVEAAQIGGTMDVFAQEFMCLSSWPGSMTFTADLFKTYNEADKEFKDALPKLQSIILVDPARLGDQPKANSAETAIIGVTVDLRKPAVYVRDIIAGHFRPDEWYDFAINMAQRLSARMIAVEDTGGGVTDLYHLTNELRKRNLGGIWTRALKAERGDTVPGKMIRINRLGRLYRQGVVYHNPECSRKLEEQLLHFPNSKRWDVMDAFAYVVKVLDEQHAFFVPGDVKNKNWAREQLEARRKADYERAQRDPASKHGNPLDLPRSYRVDWSLANV
jgi:hypothetical protein